MSLTFNQRLTDGRQCAVIRIEQYVTREDLVLGAADAIANGVEYDADSVAVFHAAQKVTKAVIEEAVRSLYAMGGSALMENRDHSLWVGEDTASLITKWAEACVSGLYPEIHSVKERTA